MEFNNETLACVSSSPAITLTTTFTTLPVVEDVATSFTLPDATTEATGSLYWFIETAPNHGDITGCADRDGAGAATGTGTQLRSCVFTPDANYVGTDAFSYKICNTENGATRCGTAVDVAVTITDDGLDLPNISATTSVSVTENSSLSFDIRATRTSTGETDPIYLCMDVIDPSNVLSAETGTKIIAPSGALAFGSTCTQVALESDSLTPILANFSATANLLACPLDDCEGEAFVILRMCQSANCDVTGINGVDDDADTDIDEEDEWLAADLLNVSARRVAITTTARNFNPAIGGTNPLVLTSVAEASAALTIGTAGTNDRVLTTATDLDGDAITYEYVPTSFFPSYSGTFSCTNGSDLACSFTPDTDFNGTVTFRYLARDTKSAASNIITVSLAVSAVNDAPIFISGTHVAGYAATPVSLQEDTALSDRTFRVGEGGSGYENTQTVRITATSSDMGVLPPSRIQVKRGSTILGNLSSVTPLSLDSSALDSDTQSYTMTFNPVAGMVSSIPVTITLTIDDGTTTASYAFDFSSVNNIDNPPSVGVDPATSLAFQLGAAAKDLTFRATPGSNDWANVSGGLQSLTVRVNSSSSTVVDASATNLSTAGGGITITKGVGAACTASSCLYTIAFDGSNDPSDDDLLLSVTPGVRGSSTVTMVVSDGTVANNVTKTTTVNVYNFVATFNGWKDVSARGVINGKYNGQLSQSSLTLGWNSLTVTEGGSPTTSYTVRVYRNTTNVLSPLPASPLSSTGVASNVLSATFTGGVNLDDGQPLNPGDREYFVLAVVPTALGESVLPTATTDQVIEVVVPPDNMVFIHRWMANLEFCTRSGQTADRSNNYRCLNGGLAAVDVAGTFYYDQQKHVYMDVFENGCPYDLGFVGDSSPGALNPVSNANKIYYDRDAGTCYFSNGAAWVSYDSTGPVANTSIAELPPLVNITRTEAKGVCANQSIQCAGGACADIVGGTTKELPSRRDMISAAAWGTTLPGNYLQTSLEDSGDVTSVLGCNVNSGPGLSFVSLGSLTNYWQSTFPSSSTSTNRMLINNSTSTANCYSRYGLQNHIGNVSEWLADTFSCTDTGLSTASCSMLSPLSTMRAGTTLDDSLAANSSLGTSYALNGLPGFGPTIPTTSTALIDIQWFSTIGVDRFHTALGLIFLEDTGVSHPRFGLPRYNVPASPPHEIEFFNFDGHGINWGVNTSSAATSYAMSQGGDWNDTGSAGRFSFILNMDGSPRPDIGFRCMFYQDPVP